MYTNLKQVAKELHLAKNEDVDALKCAQDAADLLQLRVGIRCAVWDPVTGFPAT